MSKLADSIDGDEQIELAFVRRDLGGIREVPNRIGLDSLARPSSVRLGESADVVALEEAMQRRPRQLIERRQRMSRNATIKVSSSLERTVDRGTFGPIGRSSTPVRLRHFATVFGLTPYRSLSASSEAFDRCIAARMA